MEFQPAHAPTRTGRSPLLAIATEGPLTPPAPSPKTNSVPGEPDTLAHSLCPECHSLESKGSEDIQFIWEMLILINRYIFFYCGTSWTFLFLKTHENPRRASIMNHFWKVVQWRTCFPYFLLTSFSCHRPLSFVSYSVRPVLKTVPTR